MLYYAYFKDYTPFLRIRKSLDKKWSTRFSDFLRKNLHSESLDFKKLSKYSNKCLEKSISKKISSTREHTKKNYVHNLANCTQILLIPHK